MLKKIVLYILTLTPIFILRFVDTIKGHLNGAASGVYFTIFDKTTEHLIDFWFIVGALAMLPLVLAVGATSGSKKEDKEENPALEKAQASDDAFEKLKEALAEPAKKTPPILDFQPPKLSAPEVLEEGKRIKFGDGSEWVQVKPPEPPPDPIDPELLKIAHLLKTWAESKKPSTGEN